MSRTRTERVRATLLGRDDNVIRCPRVVRLGLLFEVRDRPGGAARDPSADGAHRQSRGSAQRFRIPPGPLICRPFTGTERRISVADRNRRRVLEQALMLGLCTAHIYDPARPVLWTTASLSRGLDLFEPQGFYA